MHGLPRRTHNVLRLLQVSLDEINAKDSIEGLCNSRWMIIDKALSTCLAFEGNSAVSVLLEGVLRWGYQLNEDHPLHRKFGGSFGSVRVDKGELLFIELKRVSTTNP